MSQTNQTLSIEASRASRRGMLLGLMAAAAVPAGAVVAKAAVPVALPAAPGSPAVVAAALQPHPDAGLFRLIDELQEAKAASRRAYRAFTPFENKHFEQRGRRQAQQQAPEVIRALPGDVELGLPQPTDDDGIYGDRQLEIMRKETWFCYSLKEQNSVTTMTHWRVTPSAEARARADEIIVAHEKWSAFLSRRPRGNRKAERAMNAANRIEWAIERRIVQKTPAKTLEGLIARVRVAIDDYEDCVFDSDMANALLNNLIALSEAALEALRP
jgi:hypothetical protein